MSIMPMSWRDDTHGRYFDSVCRNSTGTVLMAISMTMIHAIGRPTATAVTGTSMPTAEPMAVQSRARPIMVNASPGPSGISAPTTARKPAAATNPMSRIAATISTWAHIRATCTPVRLFDER